MCACLQSLDADLARLAAAALGTVGDARAVGPPVRRLGNWEAVVRETAASSLIQSGPVSVEVVAAVLREEALRAWDGALHALGAAGDARAVPALLRLLQHSRQATRRAIEEALLRLQWKPTGDRETGFHCVVGEDWRVRGY